MKRKSGEIVVVCTSEIPFNEALGEYRFKHYERMTDIRKLVSVKCIVTEDSTNLPATDYCEYRHISKHYVDSVPFYVYDDKYAAIIFEAAPSPKIIVIQSPSMSRAFRQQFQSMWEKATPLNTLEKQSRKTGWSVGRL